MSRVHETIHDAWVEVLVKGAEIRGHYSAVIWTESRDKEYRTYCGLAVSLDGGWCGNESGMEYKDLSVPGDDPNRRENASAEADRILGEEGWHRIGDWTWNGWELMASVRR